MSQDKPVIQLTKNELKRLKAEQHNQQYEFNKANPKDPRQVIAEAMRDTVIGFQKGLGL